MSADSWKICPKCRLSAKREKKRLWEEVGALYGIVSSKEWLGLVVEAEKDHEECIPNTLVEYYYMGITINRVFSVHYEAKCDKCGFRFEYKHEEPIAELKEK